MDLSFGEALLIFGALLTVTAALSGVIRGTVLSASVLSIVLGIVLAELDVVSVDVGDAGVVELIELALILTLISDGLLVERELLGRHWGPAARALVFAMPITLVLLGARREAALPATSTWAEAFLLGAVLCATDPVVTSTVVTVAARSRRRSATRSTSSPGSTTGSRCRSCSSSSSSRRRAATPAARPSSWSARRPSAP